MRSTQDTQNQQGASTEWLNDVPETARRLNCSERLVRKFIYDGDLVPTKIARRVLVAESDLREFMRRHRGGESA
jgi:hypothetical protein